MSTTIVKNTRGSTVAELPVSTVNGPAGPVSPPPATPLDLLGVGISTYSDLVMGDLVRLLENFANTTAPDNPIEGMNWYDSTSDVLAPSYYNGIQWVPYASAVNSGSMMFKMLPASRGIDFSVLGTTDIFTGPGTTATFHPTSVLLIPSGTVTATTPAAFNLQVDTSEDVLENSLVVDPAANKHYSFVIQGGSRFISNTATLSLEVTTAVASGNLRMDVFVFGFTRI